jgi:hypothetical protein
MEKQIKKFTAKLISIAGKPSATATGTEFRRCTIEYKAEDGSIKQASARMWEKNFAYGVEVGESYSAKAEVWVDLEGEPRVDLTVSHLQGAGGASLSDFGFTAPVAADLNKVS